MDIVVQIITLSPYTQITQNKVTLCNLGNDGRWPQILTSNVLIVNLIPF